MHTVDLAYKPMSLKCSIHNIIYLYIYIIVQHLYFDDLQCIYTIIYVYNNNDNTDNNNNSHNNNDNIPLD